MCGQQLFKSDDESTSIIVICRSDRSGLGLSGPKIIIIIIIITTIIHDYH